MYIFCHQSYNKHIRKRGEHMDFRTYTTARTLRSPANGRIIALSELNDGIYSRRLKGDGFAVAVRRINACEKSSTGILSKLKAFIQRIFGPSEFVEICSPADGVVTEKGETLTIRTGDGVIVSVCPETKADFLPETGDKIRRGRRICVIPRADLSANSLGGAVAVIFALPEQITELHISTGRRRAGERAAFYHVHRK